MRYASTVPASGVLDASATTAALPWPALARAIETLLREPSVTVPARLVQPLAGNASLFVMPAADDTLAITKLITFTPGNAGSGRPSIQGDIVVFDVASGARRCILDGPTVTARRTAAVSALAAMRLAPRSGGGRLLVVGAGVQGRAHAEAFQALLGIEELWVASRSPASADALVGHARSTGLRAARVDDPDAALAACDYIVTATPAAQVSMHATPSPRAFVAAVGAFSPAMAEWAPDACREVARLGSLVVDTRDADHEAGDLLQAGIDVAALPTLADLLCKPPSVPLAGPVFFKSCGWAGWDLAAARCAIG